MTTKGMDEKVTVKDRNIREFKKLRRLLQGKRHI